jgi:hypothetical protein
MKILRSPDPADGGAGSTQIATSQPPAPPAPLPAPPPAATIVVEAKKTERELQLETELEHERTDRKKDQVRLSELEDENYQLKQIPKPPAPSEKSVGPISRFFGWKA